MVRRALGGIFERCREKMGSGSLRGDRIGALIMTLEEKIQKYISLGFAERHNFPDEYVLLVNRQTVDVVRIYLDGRVWRKTASQPEYVLIEG